MKINYNKMLKIMIKQIKKTSIILIAYKKIYNSKINKDLCLIQRECSLHLEIDNLQMFLMINCKQ